MDLNASRNALTQFLENGKGQVLGLSGRWGAGKTHLWLSLRDTLPAGKTALYASCFGLKSLDEIGRALLQDAASNASKYGEAGGKVIKETGRKLTDALRNIPFIGEAADALLATGALAESVITGMLVRDRIIVLDDLERRDAALSLETLFGYVDALKGKGCTVLLIYNEEELSANQGKEWRAVREKCLDAEINLRPTPADACRLGLSPACPDREPIVATAEAAGLTNIRIIQRIGRLTDAFRKAIPRQERQEQSLPEYILRSLVFLAILHYENRFPDEQVETFLEDWTRVCADQLGNTLPGDAALLAVRCSVTNDTELLALLSDFVQHHPLDATRVAARMQARDERALHATAKMAALDYVDRALYDPDATDQTFLRMARDWGATGWHALAPQMASTIIRDLQRRGGQDWASHMAEAWGRHWRKASKEYVQESVLQGLADPIAQAIREVNESRRPMQTVMDAIEQIEADPPSASEALMPFLQNISSVQLRKAIESYAFDELKRFLTFYSERLPGMEADHDRYKLAWSKFKSAANAIIVANRKPRLSDILLRHIRMRDPDFEPSADEHSA
ncbi:hypothetical protein KDH83_06555 [Achromobacter sp. Marseille-Q0513]|uniref:hypothetical protein n=1 Tax=Achromobacter sp. Marseille-Q0513 TaxID=2829161 RepID=UPI001B93084F|nr:hypothetical protein [Achromobacter sp. Marseille-Q0513]MBR8652972.1 hypothetical protein [Achromobacter sp. Marseille-Q0513]